MPDCTHHCPFLNRPDARCAGHFHLDHLSHAFAFCFGQYQSCPVYTERLEERQEWRGVVAGAAGAAAAAGATGASGANRFGSSHATDFAASPVYRPPAHAPRPRFVPLAVAGQYPEPAAGAPRIPDVPRL